jgi:hypothetical protein
MKNRLFLAAAASGVALAAVVGVALGVGHDEPRLVRSAGTSAPLEETSTTSTSPAPARADVDTEKVAEVDQKLENHEARISALESTTTTAAPAVEAVPMMSVPTAVVAEPTTTTTSTGPPTTVQPAPTTTTTRMIEPWWCTVTPADGGRPYKVPCDSTTTTTAPQ